MIINLFIIDAESGVCIYSYIYRKSIFVDENLLSGFLTAMGSFAQETFKTGLQTIQIQNGRKLSFYVETAHKLTICAVADDRDNNVLLENILNELCERFIVKYSEALNSSARNDTRTYHTFDTEIENFLKSKIKPRNKKSMIFGLIGGSVSLIGFLILITMIIGGLIQILDYEWLALFIFLYFSSILAISTFIAGFIAGNHKVGFKTGLINFFILISLILIIIPDLLNLLIYVLPFAFIVCMASGYSGGLMMDKRKLYPLDKTED